MFVCLFVVVCVNGKRYLLVDWMKCCCLSPKLLPAFLYRKELIDTLYFLISDRAHSQHLW